MHVEHIDDFQVVKVLSVKECTANSTSEKTLHKNQVDFNLGQPHDCLIHLNIQCRLQLLKEK